MKKKELVLETLKRSGKLAAETVQRNAAEMSGTELNKESAYVPEFIAACAKMNMLNRAVGFVCKSPAGRVVKLLQPYDSDVYAAEPEELPAQWCFVWSDDPSHALPFVAISTSPYMKENCCMEGNETFRSLVDYNVHAPSEYPQGWEKVVQEA
ncbi:MAG: hypothetical protein IKB53_02265 [Oscillospiraceae bacterium]|nr:hypothetical protein [Oscillospiraceae bacterium]